MGHFCLVIDRSFRVCASAIPHKNLRFQKTCPAGPLFFGAGHVSSPGNPSLSKGGAFAFRADLEIPSLYPPWLRASLDPCHMAGAEKDEAKGTLLDRFFGIAVLYGV